jgi:hypothetical protein
MAVIAKKIYIGTPSTTSATIYTVPTAKTTIIKNIVLCNTTATNAIISLTMGTKDIIKNYSVSANDTVTIDLSLVLDATDTITSIQTTTNAINLFISGVEVS